MALGGGLLAQDRPLLRGFAYPMIIIGALELGVEFCLRRGLPNRFVISKTALPKRSACDPKQELQRMRRVNRQFSLLEVVRSDAASGRNWNVGAGWQPAK